MNEQLPKDERAVEFALRQGERCRNYGPERTENEDCIVILSNEVERLRELIEKHNQQCPVGWRINV